MSIFWGILVSTTLISLISFSGALLLFFQKHLIQRISIFLLSFAAGAFMGAAFLHLLPEAVQGIESKTSFLFILFGFSIFFFIENILHLHHTPADLFKHRSLGTLSLLGDGVHNFLDGMIIAATFFLDMQLGFLMTFVVALHEIPEEIAEFGVLLYSGFSTVRALMLNFLSAITVVIGGMLSFLFAGILGAWLTPFLLFAVGVSVYIAASDFVPEIRKEQSLSKSLGLLLTFAAGIFLMWLVLFLE